MPAKIPQDSCRKQDYTTLKFNGKLKVILLSKNDVDFGDFLYLTASMAIATSAS